MKVAGYIIPGGLPALNTKGGWLIVYGQPTSDFTEPVYLSDAAGACSALGGACEWPQTCAARGSCAYGVLGTDGGEQCR